MNNLTTWLRPSPNVHVGKSPSLLPTHSQSRLSLTNSRPKSRSGTSPSSPPSPGKGRVLTPREGESNQRLETDRARGRGLPAGILRPQLRSRARPRGVRPRPKEIQGSQHVRALQPGAQVALSRTAATRGGAPPENVRLRPIRDGQV